MSFGIRSPLMQDLGALTALVSQPGVAEGVGLLPFTPAAWMRDRLLNAQGEHAIVGTLDGVAVGWASLTRNSGRRNHSARLLVMVRDDLTGRGLGRGLVRELLVMADDWLGLRRVELDVLVDNSRAVALYESLGFEREGILRGAMMTGGTLRDMYAMARLRPAPEHLPSCPVAE